MAALRAGKAEALHLRGVVLPEGSKEDVFVIDGRITFQPPPRVSAVFDAGYLLPGLVDMHAHLGLASPAPHNATPQERVRASARMHLEHGILAIREPGGPDRSSAGIRPDEGLPRIFTGGRFLAPPGGYFPGLAREVEAEDLPRAAEEEAKASHAWAKVVGDFISPEGKVQLNFQSGTLAEAARRVHATGARIAVHATSSPAIEAAIEAGFDSIEHGVGLTDDSIALMAKRRIALVPALTITPIIVNPEFWTEQMGASAAVAKSGVSAVRKHARMVRRAAEAGVLVLAGTDAGMGPHGMVREEIQRLIEAGLPPETALAAGSWEARRFLGLPGLEEGAPADIVGYAENPLENHMVLAQPSLRILDGRVITPAALKRH